MNEVVCSGRIYTIAEMSANHAGKLENALEIVKAAAESGADCLKIQTYTADTITIDCRSDLFLEKGGLWDKEYLYDLYSRAYMPWEWQKRIREECDKYGLDFLSTPFDNTAVDFLESIGCEAYKIASFEIVDIPLIRYAASKEKPMIISTGMASKEEIRDAIEACKDVGNSDITILKCCSEYPSDPDNLNLDTISDMAESFGVIVGLSDHSMGYMADVVAAAKGAKVIEKHFCLSRSLKNADSDFSMEPAEFKEMVENVALAVRMLGKSSYGPSEGEKEEFKCRRSLFAVKDIKRGEILTSENVRSIRPGAGLPPKYLPEILGRTAVTDIPFGTPLSMNMIGEEL
ncbi:MAG: pseudaminic acid synthase [Lachnospiraceae bacterium]|nr:pseudaminic acid synthase [Lachnospiraceae bacterium]